MIATLLSLAMGTPPQGAANGAAPQGNMLTMFAPLIIIFVIFYFLLIRPQQKQQKKMQTMLQAIKKGDQVITRGGIHGKITGIADNVLTIEVANNVQMKFSRDSIVNVTPSAS
ncbi:MAG: preprotein translocase subunit YajC [Deltaproteobacteria bacterium]|nr:preprotein translocase subunit YajC [Deltaproteobacteria bacterium]